MNEINDFPEYFSTDEGHIWSAKSNRMLSESPDSNGYMKVNIRQNGKDRVVVVHRLIALAYLPVPYIRNY